MPPKKDKLNSQEELKRIVKAAKSLVNKYGKYWPTDCVPKCTDGERTFHANRRKNMTNGIIFTCSMNYKGNANRCYFNLDVPVVIKVLSACHDLFKNHGQLSQDLIRKHLPQPVKDIAMDYYNRRLDLRNKRLQKIATVAAASTPPRDSIPNTQVIDPSW